MSEALLIYLVWSYLLAGLLWAWALAELVYVEVEIYRYRNLLRQTLV